MTKRILSMGESDIAYLGIERCLEPDGLELVGGPNTGAGALDAVRAHAPSLVLIRRIASDVAGFQLCREIAEEFPALPVILCLIEPDEHAVADAIHVGARACIDARLSCSDLRRAILTVIHGGSLFTPEQHAAMRQEESLTPRELDALKLAVQGFNLHESARQLGTRPGTVRNQLAEVRSKLGVHTTYEAIIRALRRGLVVA